MMCKKTIGALIVLLILSSGIANAQLIINNGGSAQSLADLIEGQGIQISNPVINCATNGWGTYNSNVPNFTSEEGIILSTGRVVDAIGPNNTESRSTSFGTPGSPLLTAVSGFSTYDACTFEFDIVPQGDTLKFDFVFASEEYQEYVGSSFNDVFGFFISGPGIVGDPGLGVEKNIALLPGTNTAVTINNINNGNPNTNPPYPPTNPAYFNANPLNPNAQIQYDGWTVNLQAIAQVTPCETYHLKLIIADASDRVWDSGVFIEKIESNNVQLSTTTVGGIDNMIEGCNNGEITFTRQNVTAQPLDVEFYVQGTAINGVDYAQIGADPNPLVPKTITIPANQASASINVIPFDDGIVEGEEYLLVLIGNPQCNNAISDSIRFYIHDSLDVFIDPPITNICEGGDVTFSVTNGGTAFSWDPPTFLNDPNIKEPTASNVTQSTTYILTSTVASCVATDTTTVNTENVSVSLAASQISCNGANDGSITATVTGGLPGYSYAWSGSGGYSSTSQNISNLAPGSYTLTVVDQGGCQGSGTVTITQPNVLTVALDSPQFTGGFNLSCFESGDGSITASASGGTAPYSFQLNDPASQTGTNPTNLAAGTYTMTVTDAHNCTGTATITLTQPSAVTATILAQQNVLCHGQSTGSATAQGNGGVGNYSFSWNTTPPQFTATATGLGAGTYTVTITDANNCTETADVIITEPAAPISITTSKTNVNCFGNATGTATASATGGTGTLTYTWNTIPVQTGPTATGLSAGTYTVTVTDDNNCSNTANVTITQPNAALGINVTSTTDVNCVGDATGTATVQGTGGTPNYTYQWNTTPVQNGPVATNLTAGNYSVTITDANGCTESTIVTISEPAEPLSVSLGSQTNVNCFGEATGAATVAASGGESPYSYTWNTNPATTGATISGVVAGSYTVTVVDGNGCTQTLTVEITQPTNALSANISNVQHVLCFGESTGSATVNTSGGTPGYSYLWNDPSNQTTATATGLAAGTYSVTVTDDNGCTGTVSVTITQPASALDASITAQTNVACFGNATGAATVIGSGGSGSYSYSWSPGGYTTSTANNLLAGTYSVTVTDNNGCLTPVVIIVEITQPAAGIMANLTSPTVIGGWNIACNGDASGSIDLEVSGGSPPYSYTWFEANGDTTYTQDLSGIIAGVYTVIISDGGECTLTQSIELTQPDPIDFTFEMTPSLCFGSNEGEIKLNLFGGTAGYDLSWTGPDGFTSTDSDLFNLYGGIYVFTVIDTNGCVFSSPITVTQPEDIVISVDSVSLFPGGWNVSCHDSEDGFIFITPTGGTQPYNYVWQGPNNPFFSNSQDVSDLPGGNYEVVLIDDNNCIQNLFIELLTPDSISILLDAFQYPGGAEVSCVGASDGSIISDVFGGTVDYSYNWSGPPGFPGAISENLNNLSAGTYVLEITDENGCMTTEAVRIDPPDSLIISVTSPTYFGNYNISCFGADDGSIDLSIAGGVPGYTVSWTGPNGFASTDVNLTNLEAGDYCATVTDTNDCEEVICITLTEPAELTATPISLTYNGGWNIDCNGAFTGSIDVTTVGGNPPYTFAWSGPGFFSSSQEDIDNVEAGEYCLTITDANNCTWTDCITLTEPDALSISFTGSDFNGSGVSCVDSDDGTLDATVTGGTESYNYSWDGPNGFTSNSNSLTGLEAGTYCLNVTDANGCSAENCFEITEPAALTVALSAPTVAGGFHIDCNGNDSGSINSTVSGGTAGFSYSWNGPGGFTSTAANLSNLEAGIYCVEVTDQNGCKAAECIELVEPDELTANATIAPVACNSAATGSIDLNLSGGTAPYTIIWDNGGSTELITDLDAGVYNVIVSDANGCVFESSYEIEEPEDLQLALSSPTFVGGHNIDCFGESTGSIGNNVVGGTAPYVYSWTGPNGFVSADSSLVGVPAGEYCLEVIDFNGCEATACITLTEPAELSVSINQTAEVLCNGEAEAALQAVPTGGNAAYNYAWTGPNGYTGIGVNITGLEAGVYCVTATDINGCTAQECFEITEPDALTLGLSSPVFAGGFNINCYQGNDGSISVTVGGGSGNYSYFWTGPNGYTSTSGDITDLVAGEYCLVVLDENDCVIEDCITLTQPEPLDVDLTAIEYNNAMNVSCYGACDGAIEATVTGGAGPFDFAWEGPNGFTSSDTTLIDLCAGMYILTTTDANSCVKTDSIFLVEPDVLDIELTSPTYGGGANISCHGGNTGGIFSDVTGGSPDYIYDWSGPDGFMSNDSTLELLGAGTYYLTILDVNGCTANDSIVLTEPLDSLYATAEPTIYPSGTNISCWGADDGAIDLTVYGGIAPYTYNWDGAFNFDSDQEDISDLQPGDYTVVIVDANECTYTVNLVLTEPDAPLELSLSATPITCNDGTDGSISSTVSGGSPSYEYSWSGPDGFTSNNQNLADIGTGSYILIVTDTNGCVISDTLFIDQPDAITIDGEVVDATCDAADGSISVSADGGTGAHTYSWSNGDSSASIDNLESGTYTVTVTDENECTAVAEFFVGGFNPLELSLTAQDLMCYGDSTGEVSSELLNGVPPVTYYWEGPGEFTSEDPIIVGLQAGTYTLSVADGNNCTATATVTVYQPDSLILDNLFSPYPVSGIAYNISTPNGSDGSIFSLIISGGTPGYDADWNGPNGFEETGVEGLSGLTAGTYTVTVTDNNGCTVSQSITLTEPFDLDLPNGISPNGDLINDALIVRGLELFPNNQLIVFNRWGNIVYEEDNYRNETPWYGVSQNGSILPDGTYFVIVKIDADKDRELKGYLEIRR